MTNMRDFFNWARQIQSNNPETSDAIRDVVSGQWGGNSNTPTPSIEDTIEPTTPTEPTVEESVEQLDEAGIFAKPRSKYLALAKAKLKKGGGRQLKDPKTEVMVVDKKGKVIVIDKKDLKKYLAKGWGLAESVELDERTKTRTFEFPDNRKAKQFAKDIANSSVATGTVSGNRVIDVEVLKGSPSVAKSAIAKYLKQNRGKEISESFELDESKMSEFHMHVKDGKTAQQIAKIMKIDLKTVKALMKGMKKESVELDEAKKPDFTVTAMKGSKTLESMPASKKELNDAVKLMKRIYRNAKIIVKDSKGKTKAVYESRDIKKEYLDLDNRTNKILKKVLDIS